MDNKYEKLKSKNRSLKIWNVLTIIGLLIALTIVFTRNTEVTNQNVEISHKNDSISDVKSISDIEYQSEILNTKSKLDTIKGYTHDELEVIKKEIKNIKNSTNNNSTKKSLANLEKKVNDLSNVTTVSDTINVYYFKRNKDQKSLIKSIENIDYTYYNVIKKTPTKDKNKKNNVVYYGKFVPKSVVDTLVVNLKNSGMEISRVKPFILGYKYKENSLEIGYEKVDEVTKKNGEYNIKLFSYKPDAIKKNEIANALVNEGYQVKVLPDWEEKMSFFSDKSTILYYNSNKERAEEIAKELNEKLNFRLSVKEGTGLGVLESEKNNLFIIHYNGS